MTEQNNNSISIRDYIDTRFEAIMLNASQRFDAQQLALKDALMAQEKQTALALINTEKAIDKADLNTEKRFALLTDKIDGAVDAISKSTGAQGIYVTHSDLSGEMEKLRVSFEGMLRPVITFMNSATGQQKGISGSWSVIVTAISISATLILLGLRLLGK
jgi:hypothetical protein